MWMWITINIKVTEYKLKNPCLGEGESIITLHILTTVKPV